MEEFYKQLYKVQATLFHLFQKTWVYHWNVVGSDFYQLHQLFGEQYEFMFGEVDKISEHIRYFSIKALGPLTQIKTESEILDANMNSTSMEMVSDLLKDNEKLIQILAATNKMAEENDQPQTANLIQQIMEDHGKFVWMLRSMLRTV
jgi:starvation-inducible DNA-binding protein